MNIKLFYYVPFVVWELKPWVYIESSLLKSIYLKGINLFYRFYTTAKEKDKPNNKKSYNIKRFSDKEIRVLSCDVALMNSKNGNDNDNAIITYFRCIPNKEKYEIQVLHQEAIEGGTVDLLALRLKQLFHDGDCDYIVLDTASYGIPVLDALGNFTNDRERGIQYSPLKCMNDDKYAERCGYAEAQKCIYCIVGNAKLNHEIATTLKATFQQKGIKLLRNQFEVTNNKIIESLLYQAIGIENSLNCWEFLKLV